MAVRFGRGQRNEGREWEVDTWPSGNCGLATGSEIGMSDSVPGSGCTTRRVEATETLSALGRTVSAAG